MGLCPLSAGVAWGHVCHIKLWKLLVCSVSIAPSCEARASPMLPAVTLWHLVAVRMASAWA